MEDNKQTIPSKIYKTINTNVDTANMRYEKLLLYSSEMKDRMQQFMLTYLRYIQERQNTAWNRMMFCSAEMSSELDFEIHNPI